jgi:pimeloyl-ACP methyl ester carboxylesterase
VQLHVVRHGASTPQFVLVHGLASNAHLWDGVGEALAARGFGSIAVDLRGHGRSPKPDDGYDFDSVVGDLVPLLDGRPVLVGQSYGGNVVVALASRHPRLVSSIVCVDGGAIDLRQRFDTVEEALVAMKPPYELFEGITLEEEETFLRRMHPDWPETGIAGVLAGYELVDGLVRSRLTWARHAQIVEAMWNEPPDFARVDVPVLFITATERMRTGVDAAVAQLRDGRAVFVEGADHDVHAQHPELVAEHLISMVPA